MEPNSRYDIAVIGSGPGGLEAAITAKVRNKNVILFGEPDLSRKLSGAHRIDNYLGFPQVPGEVLAENFQKHLSQMGLSITQERITAIYSMGDYFALQGKNGNYEASAVILATGVVMEKPFPGENENLGRGVSYCATCDAALYRGKTAIVLGYSAKEEEEAAFLAEIADHVTYLPMYEAGEGFGELESNPKITVRTGVKPLSIEKADALMRLRTDSGEDFDANGIFVLREAIAPSQLVPGLETEGNAVVCDRQMKTNIAGLFVCGDIAGAPYQYIKAAGEGNVAALSAVSYLSALARK
ncbi:MAG: NAD(P)/FAD-dependent oxidoreductase [Lachnospiraceae bacterium]|nr:NAD(P)/FAD-dependent oxidoreductase [Lachnospiraceae bacterium]